MNAPCKECTKRYIGCHSECLDYIDFTQAQNAKKKAIFEARAKDSIANNVRIESKKRRLRKLGKKV